MFDGRFDPGFYQAFLMRQESADTRIAPVRLPKMALIDGLGLFVAVCLMVWL
jgi:hypothetical protein